MWCPIFKPQKLQVAAVIIKEKAAVAASIIYFALILIFAPLFIWPKKIRKNQ
jgi:hypothetical protein